MTKTTIPSLAGEHEYLNALNSLLDQIYDLSADKGWSWAKLAAQSGLCYGTVCRMGNYQTTRPQLRSVLLLARAVGYQLVMVKRMLKTTRTRTAQSPLLAAVPRVG